MSKAIYKVTFIKNEISSCRVVTETVMQGSLTYEKHNGFLIYALVKASNELKALEKAKQLISQLSIESADHL